MPLDPRLETGGAKMAHKTLRSAAELDGTDVARLVRAGAALNAMKGDPTKTP